MTIYNLMNKYPTLRIKVKLAVQRTRKKDKNGWVYTTNVITALEMLEEVGEITFKEYEEMKKQVERLVRIAFYK